MEEIMKIVSKAISEKMKKAEELRQQMIKEQDEITKLNYEMMQLQDMVTYKRHADDTECKMSAENKRKQDQIFF